MSVLCRYYIVLPKKTPCMARMHLVSNVQDWWEDHFHLNHLMVAESAYVFCHHPTKSLCAAETRWTLVPLWPQRLGQHELVGPVSNCEMDSVLFNRARVCLHFGSLRFPLVWMKQAAAVADPGAHTWQVGSLRLIALLLFNSSVFL